jgi:drug/metabolite transporter (DMT)-like permease
MVTIWSFSFVIVDFAVIFLPPLSIALYRFTITTIIFIIIDIYVKLRKGRDISKEKSDSKVKLTKNDWYLLIFSSFTGVSFFFYTQYNAIDIIGPSLSSLIVCLLVPVIITILSLIFFDEKLDKFKIIGFVFATIGGYLLITGGDITNLTPESPHFIGYMLALLQPILWSLYSIATKKLIKTHATMDILKYVSYLGVIELFFLVLINGELFVFISGIGNIILFLCVLYLSLGCYVIGYYIWQTSQHKIESSKVTSFLYIEPFLTLLFSIIFQRSEIIVIWNVLGGIIVLIAVLLINYK